MQEKSSKLLDFLIKVASIFKPKAYNTIAKRVVFIGLLQIVEAEVKFVHAIVIALFEKFIGVSAILRDFLSATSNPTIGFSLVITGLIYHLAVTLGKGYIETKISGLPRVPNLKCSLLNGDKEELDVDFTLRGKRVGIPRLEDIPINKDFEPEAPIGAAAAVLGLGATYGSRFGKRKNEDLYKERAKLLGKWAGAELLYVKLSNDSETLATGVSVELAVRKQKGLCVALSTPHPALPADFIDDDAHRLLHIDRVIKAVNPKAVSLNSDSEHHRVLWTVNRLQAQTEECSDDCFLLKTDKPVTIECTIFSDELPKPTTTSFLVKPTLNALDVSIEQLMNSNSFEQIYDSVVMDGYYSRLWKSITDKYQP